jgi:hypothetical protein
VGSGKFLRPFRPDLFVILRQLAPDISLIDLTDCDIFEFAATQADFQVWVLREITTTPDRQIAESSEVSLQKAAILIEDSGTSGSAVGFSQPGTMMVDGKGAGLLRTYKIQENVQGNCGEGPCNIDGIGSLYVEDTICYHFKNTAIHEIWHVLSALKTPDLHIAGDAYIMSPAVIFTGDTYYIGDEFSAAGLNDPSFQ